MGQMVVGQDGKATLRLFGKADDVLRRLLPEVGLAVGETVIWMTLPFYPD